jgi:UPF0716 protein FxsA
VPLLYLLLLFTVLPLAEFTMLVKIHDQIGLPATIALVLGTGVLGAALAKQQGVRTLTRIREEMAGGKMPGDALLDGALILVAGAVLITPGVLTDAMGFALLIPPLRAVIKRGLRAWFARNVRIQTHTTGQPWPPGRQGGEIIDAQVIETHVEKQ